MLSYGAISRLCPIAEHRKLVKLIEKIGKHCRFVGALLAAPTDLAQQAAPLQNAPLFQRDAPNYGPI